MYINKEIQSKIERIEKFIKLIIRGEPYFSLLEKHLKEKNHSDQYRQKITTVNSGKEGALKELELTIKSCKKCPLYEKRTQAVPGVGDCNTKLMIIGEAPGQEEDIRGEPFVGRAGQLLTKLLNQIGIERKDIYITNIVKCRPPENRTPKDEEILACSGYLKSQIEIISPKVILILGRTALKALLDQEKISKVRGQSTEIDGTIYFSTFHPAAVLRDEHNKMPLIIEDFKKIGHILRNI